MARYGSRYYTDLESLTVGINQGLSKAFKLTCDELVDEIKQWTDVYIYSTEETDTYSPRTEEYRNAWDYEVYSVNNGLQQATFYVNIDKIKTKNDTVFHNIIRQGGTTDDLTTLIEEFDHHDGFRDEIEFWLRDEFQKKYRANCQKLGIVLQG